MTSPAPDLKGPLLEVAGLDVFYGDFQALFGVSLSVAGGRATALVGANGAGKTTLLRTIAGAQPPAAGSVRYRGRDLTAAPPHRRISAGIALVPEGRKLFASLTVEENIQVGAAAAASADWPLRRIYDVFPMLARRRGQRASTLSGGEQQAVAIARALAAAPTLLLLDEISLGLAPRVVGELYQTLTALRAEGATLLIVEQDLRRAMAECDDLVCLLEGRVAVATAALAGVFIGTIGTFDPYQGTNTLIFAFEAVVIGGIGSLWGTLAGGMALGVTQVVVGQANQAYAVLAVHLLFLAVLAVRPNGLFVSHQAARQAGALG